jgi:hypothetical protein
LRVGSAGEAQLTLSFEQTTLHTVECTKGISHCDGEHDFQTVKREWKKIRIVRPTRKQEENMRTTLPQNTIKKLVGTAVIGAFVFVPALGTISAQADPPRHAPAYGRRAKDRHDWKKHKKHKKHYDRKDRYRYDRNDRDRYDRDRYRNDRDRYNRNDRNRYNDRRSYTGVITRVRSNDEFDIRVGGTTYNVYLSSRAPRQLSRNDYVRVSGVRSGSNDIRNASVTLLRNR